MASRVSSIVFLVCILNSICSAFVLSPRRAISSSWRSMSTSGTNSAEISNYLNRNVEAVDLPDKIDKEDSTYPPLILDGASGTGKTQQAFALVKERTRMIYFLMSEEQTGNDVKEQLVYRSLRGLTRDEGDIASGSFARLADEATKALRENKNITAKDICAVEFLRSTIDGVRDKPIDFKGKLWARNTDSDVKGIDPLMDVVLKICSKHLQYDADSGLRVVPLKHGDNKNVRFGDLYSQLKGIILFLDEALPKSKLSADDGPDPAAIDRLRFVRNLGRALEMRVVLAGTAATAANMIADVRDAASRYEPGELPWVECQFLWQTMSENDVKGVVLPNIATPNKLQQALISELARGRPYLVHLLGRVMNESFEEQQINSGNLLVVLEEMGDALASAKGMSAESILVYLTGVWLYQVYTPPSAFRLKPADLVRGNFFEPGVVVDLNGYPACDLLMGKRKLASGHLRVKVYRYFYETVKRMIWCASLEETNSDPRDAFCWDFSGVEYSLRACIQQCLAREPVLAVALSTQCAMDKATFRNALSMLYQENNQQRNVGQVDGELNEHILFALLQLASNSQGLSGGRVKLGTFLQKIADYSSKDYDTTFAQGVKKFRDKLDKYRGSGPVKMDAKRLGLEIDDQASKHTLPWLVPAHSLEALKQTVARASSLFNNTDIAGLVPGEGNKAPFDALAYSWNTLANETEDAVTVPEWAFEFKARASAYTTDEALEELQGKCVGLQKKLDKKLERAPKKKKDRLSSDQADKLQCHAILIATSGGYESRCKIDYSDDTQKYLRVALVIGLGRN